MFIKAKIIALYLLAISLGGLSTPLNAFMGDYAKGQIIIEGKVDALSPGTSLIKYLPRSNLSIVRVEPGRELAAIQAELDRGKHAHLNRIAKASAVPNDPFYSFQWHFPAIQAEQAWDVTAGAGVIVAVLDTGLATGAQDGIGCVVAGYDYANMDTDTEDGDGHGTHVSGTIAQASNNGIGVAGLAYDACIMPVKVLGDDGSGSFADITEGVYHAVDNGAKVINMSLGTNARFGITSDPVMDAALDYAEANGVTVVCASGNDGQRKNVSYPAIYPTTIAVGATDVNNNVVRYSNKGTGLDMVAPGGDVSSDNNNDGYADGVLQETRDAGSWTYVFWQGTSMASPHVAGAAAMLIANQTASTPEEVRTALFSSALDIGDAGFDKTSGHGLLQVHNALTGGGPPPPPPPPSGTDADGDGVTVEGGDCDDNNPNVYPGHSEKGRWGRDGVDNDCNGVIDG